MIAPENESKACEAGTVADETPEKVNGALAIVLHFNARMQLPACISALQKQSAPPEQILVVDNNSDDPPCREELQALGPIAVELLELPENLGPAGGYAAGLNAFLRTSHSNAWIMDDDVVPALDCLEQLTQAQRSHGARVVVVPVVEDVTNGIWKRGWGWWGPLIPRRAIEIVGVPRAEFFYGDDDADYLIDRLPAAGYPAIHCEGATVQVTLRPQGSAKPSWKYYYEARNRTYRNLYVRRVPFVIRIKSLVLWIARYFAAILTTGPPRLRNLVYFIRGLADGALGRLGKRVSPTTSDRPFQSSHSGSD
jgi:GT2 family glycosyltransferase